MGSCTAVKNTQIKQSVQTRELENKGNLIVKNILDKRQAIEVLTTYRQSKLIRKIQRLEDEVQKEFGTQFNNSRKKKNKRDDSEPKKSTGNGQSLNENQNSVMEQREQIVINEPIQRNPILNPIIINFQDIQQEIIPKKEDHVDENSSYNEGLFENLEGEINSLNESKRIKQMDLS